MTQLPLVSVIVPVYKVESYLDCCVQSIVNQTYSNLEIILIDDDSPDASGAMCDAWAEKDSRIRVIHQENAGGGAARNAGLDAARGERIAFVDSDDYIDPDFTEHLVTAAEQNNAGCSVRADVLDHAFDSAIEKHDFAVCYIVKPVNDSYSVADGECKADLLVAVIKSETGNILAQ